MPPTKPPAGGGGRRRGGRRSAIARGHDRLDAGADRASGRRVRVEGGDADAAGRRQAARLAGGGRPRRADRRRHVGGRASGPPATLGASSPVAGAVFAILMAPQVLRIDIRQDLQHLELLKTWPVKASAVVRGELLWPGVLITGARVDDDRDRD